MKNPVVKNPEPIQFSRKISIKWFGASAFEFRFQRTILLIDPFVTRPNFLSLLFSELKPNDKLINRHFKEADHILVSHGHYDHIMDVPTIARAARFLVLATDYHLKSRTASDELYAGWGWT